MKKINFLKLKFTIHIVLVIISIASITAWKNPTKVFSEKKVFFSKENLKFVGFSRAVRCGLTTTYLNCGEEYTVFVASSSEEINTGTHIYGNPNCTVPAYDGVVTSLSGSTYGQTFYVVNSIVAGTASPC